MIRATCSQSSLRCRSSLSGSRPFSRIVCLGSGTVFHLKSSHAAHRSELEQEEHSENKEAHPSSSRW